MGGLDLLLFDGSSLLVSVCLLVLVGISLFEQLVRVDGSLVCLLVVSLGFLLGFVGWLLAVLLSRLLGRGM